MNYDEIIGKIESKVGRGLSNWDSLTSEELVKALQEVFTPAAGVQTVAGVWQEPVAAYIDLGKMAIGGMVYATNFRMNDKQTEFRAVPGPQEQFFQLEGEPNAVTAAPDIEEDLGRLLVEVDRALQFMCVPPSIEITEAQFKDVFDQRVTPVMAKVSAILANRIMVKHPFNVLADMFFHTQNGRLVGTDRFVVATNNMEHVVDQLQRCYEKDSYIGTKEGAAEVIACLASMATSMQVIMNLYGWSWDDVKLKARMQMAANGV